MQLSKSTWVRKTCSHVHIIYCVRFKMLHEVCTLGESLSQKLHWLSRSFHGHFPYAVRGFHDERTTFRKRYTTTLVFYSRILLICCARFLRWTNHFSQRVQWCTSIFSWTLFTSPTRFPWLANHFSQIVHWCSGNFLWTLSSYCLRFHFRPRTFLHMVHKC